MKSSLAPSLLLVPLMLAAATSVAAAEISVEEGIVYARRGALELKLDLARPPGSGAHPAVVCIHGGGWREGHRGAYRGALEGLAGAGYVAASIDYRLSDVAPWPAQIEDTRAALAWLVAHAAERGIDPERIGLMGDSAGAHLALLAALMPSEREEAFRPRVVVNFYGPTDLRKPETFAHLRPMFEELMGGKLEEKLGALKEASPIVWVDRTDPPVLTFHGSEDRLVPVAQARALHAALTEAQVPNRLEIMEGVGHRLGGDPARRLEILGEFAGAYLKGTDLPLVAREDFDHGTARWEPTDRSAWKLVSKGGRTWYALTKKQSDYRPKVRSPLNISLLRGVEVGDFVLDVDLRSSNEPYGHQSLCLFFGHRDPTHFYYVHFGRRADAHANSIFLVNDAPRVSIARERTSGTDWSRGWHRARVRREVASGRIEVYFDDFQKPAMVAVDRTFTRGRVGVGSFDDTGDFDAVRLWGCGALPRRWRQ